MKATLHRLADDWERTALWVVSLACVLLSLAWLLAPGPSSPRPVPAGTRPQASMLGPNACAFLSPHQSQTQMEGTFGFSYTLPEQSTTTVEIDPAPVPGGGTGGTAGGTTEPGVHSAPPRVDAPPPKDPPVPPPTTRSVRYLGTYESTEGQRLAALAVRNPTTGDMQTRFLRSGQTYGQFRVVSFDAESLRVLAPDGTRATVPRGTVRTVTMD